MADENILFGPEAVRQMIEIARRVLTEWQNAEGHRGRWTGGQHAFLLGKTDSAINKGASGTVSIYSGTKGSETDTGINLTGVYNHFANVGSGKWVIVVELQNGLELIAAEC